MDRPGFLTDFTKVISTIGLRILDLNYSSIDDMQKRLYLHSVEINSYDDLINLKYQDIPAWDSLGHMSMVGALEDEFDIMLEMDDIIDFSSFKKGIEILKKYKVEII